MQLVLAKRGQSHQRVLPLLTGSLLHRGPPQDDAVRLAVTTGGRLERPRISSIPCSRAASASSARYARRSRSHPRSEEVTWQERNIRARIRVYSRVKIGAADGVV